MIRLGADERTLSGWTHTEHILTSLKGWCESKHGYPEAKHSWIFKYSTLLDLGNRSPDIWISTRYYAGMYAMMLVPIFDLVLTVRPAVQRVHWIWAQAQKNQWAKELLLLKYKMQWMTRALLHKAWVSQESFEEPNTDLGPKAYATRQSSQWRSMALDVDSLFRSANSEYKLLVWCNQ